jgi:hypothetical protein
VSGKQRNRSRVHAPGADEVDPAAPEAAEGRRSCEARRTHAGAAFSLIHEKNMALERGRAVGIGP